MLSSDIGHKRKRDGDKSHSKSSKRVRKDEEINYYRSHKHTKSRSHIKKPHRFVSSGSENNKDYKKSKNEEKVREIQERRQAYNANTSLEKLKVNLSMDVDNASTTVDNSHNSELILPSQESHFISAIGPDNPTQNAISNLNSRQPVVPSFLPPFSNSGGSSLGSQVDNNISSNQNLSPSTRGNNSHVDNILTTENFSPSTRGNNSHVHIMPPAQNFSPSTRGNNIDSGIFRRSKEHDQPVQKDTQIEDILSHLQNSPIKDMAATEKSKHENLDRLSYLNKARNHLISTLGGSPPMNAEEPPSLVSLLRVTIRIELQKLLTYCETNFKDVTGELKSVNESLKALATRILALERQEDYSYLDPPDFLPFTTTSQMKNFKNGPEQDYKDLVKYFRFLGGRNLNDAIKNCLYISMTHELASKYTTLGTENKYAFTDTKLFNAIYEGVNKKFGPFTQTEYLSAVGGRLKSFVQNYRNLKNKGKGHQKKQSRRSKAIAALSSLFEKSNQSQIEETSTSRLSNSKSPQASRPLPRSQSRSPSSHSSSAKSSESEKSPSPSRSQGGSSSSGSHSRSQSRSRSRSRSTSSNRSGTPS